MKFFTPALKAGLIRFGRGMAGIAVAYGVQVLGSQVVNLPVPVAYQPLIPMIAGPALNGLARFGREHLDPEGIAAKLANSVL